MSPRLNFPEDKRIPLYATVETLAAILNVDPELILEKINETTGRNIVQCIDTRSGLSYNTEAVINLFQKELKYI